MINVVDGELYHVYAETDEEALQIVAEFFSSGEHDND